MPYIKSTDTDVLELPSDSAYTVTMKQRASFGDVEAARSSMIKINTGTLNDPQIDTKVEYGNYVKAILLRLITSWTLTDEQDMPLAITGANIDRLDPMDGDFLAGEAQKRSALRPQVQEVPFVKSSGAS